MHLPTLASTLLLPRAPDPLANQPDWSKDKFPPYPSMTNPDGTNITIENLRGTRLFGWKGCEVEETKIIAEAFDDFYKLAQPLSSGIDWASEVAEDFWGKNEGPNRVPDDRRKQILQVFQAQQQMYAIGWHLLPPYWTSLWIEVRWPASFSRHSFSDLQRRWHVAGVTVPATRTIYAKTRSPTMGDAVEGASPRVTTAATRFKHLPRRRPETLRIGIAS
ncbi:hypothetical protein IQ07DRAFT_584144 [Pyrenochaeta sp. DS3sAY3a]|nr:hypothetical protein IQ07DRAFT_584144 [Pyrenochaeta sp. DS3sAY3a]